MIYLLFSFLFCFNLSFSMVKEEISFKHLLPEIRLLILDKAKNGETLNESINTIKSFLITSKSNLNLMTEKEIHKLIIALAMKWKTNAHDIVAFFHKDNEPLRKEPGLKILLAKLDLWLKKFSMYEKALQLGEQAYIEDCIKQGFDTNFKYICVSGFSLMDSLVRLKTYVLTHPTFEFNRDHGEEIICLLLRRWRTSISHICENFSELAKTEPQLIALRDIFLSIDRDYCSLISTLMPYTESDCLPIGVENTLNRLIHNDFLYKIALLDIIGTVSFKSAKPLLRFLSSLIPLKQKIIRKIIDDYKFCFHYAHTYKKMVQALKADRKCLYKTYLYGSHPVATASAIINKQMLILYLQSGFNINTRIDRWGRTALFYAQTKDSILYLYSLGANINVQDKEGLTPLMYFYETNNEDIFKIFLELGASPAIANYQGRTIFDMIKIDHQDFTSNDYYKLLTHSKDKGNCSLI